MSLLHAQVYFGDTALKDDLSMRQDNSLQVRRGATGELPSLVVLATLTGHPNMDFSMASTS